MATRAKKPSAGTAAALANATNLIARMRDALSDYPSLHTDALRKAAGAFLDDAGSAPHPVLELLDILEMAHNQSLLASEQMDAAKHQTEQIAKRVRRML